MNLLQNQNFKKNKKELKKFSFENNFHLVYISVTLFFSGFFLSVFYGFQTMIPLSSFLKIFTLLVIIPYLLQILVLRPVFPMKRMEFLMFSLFGIGPALSALFLILNYYIHTEQSTNVYKINEVKNKDQYQYFKVNGIPCEEYPELCVLHENDLILKKDMMVDITLAKGIGGFRIIKKIHSIDE